MFEYCGLDLTQTTVVDGTWRVLGTAPIDLCGGLVEMVVVRGFIYLISRSCWERGNGN